MSQQEPAPSVARDLPPRPLLTTSQGGCPTGTRTMSLLRRAATASDGRRRATAVLAVAALAVLSWSGVAQRAARAETDEAPVDLHWTSCGGGFPGGRATVPPGSDRPRAT